MNTLSRAITARFFTTPDQYIALRRHWSALANSPRKHELCAEHHLLYLALLGKDWRRAFTPISNANKLANGAYYGWMMFRALAAVHRPIALRLAMMEALRAALPDRLREQLDAQQPQDNLDNLLAPFDGLVTEAMLEAVRTYLTKIDYYSYPQTAYTPGNFPFDAYNVPVEAQGA